MLVSGNPGFETYNLQAFLDLQELFYRINLFFRPEKESLAGIFLELPVPVRTYLEEQEFAKIIQELNGNSSNQSTFRKRFFQWWNAFRILKFLNFAHSVYYKRKDAAMAAEELLTRIVEGYSVSRNPRHILEKLREIERC